MDFAPLFAQCPDVTALFQATSDEVAATMSINPADPDAPVVQRIGALMDLACGGDAGGLSLDPMFAYLATAHGVHRAANSIRAQGNDPDYAAHLHDLGQLFILYAIGEVETMRDAFMMTAATNTADETRPGH